MTRSNAGTSPPHVRFSIPSCYARASGGKISCFRPFSETYSRSDPSLKKFRDLTLLLSSESMTVGSNSLPPGTLAVGNITTAKQAGGSLHNPTAKVLGGRHEHAVCSILGSFLQ